MTWRGFVLGWMRSKMSSHGKSEANVLLKMVVGGGDEALELNGTGDEGARSRWFGGLAKCVGIDNALDAINSGGEECCVAFDC